MDPAPRIRWASLGFVMKKAVRCAHDISCKGRHLARGTPSLRPALALADNRAESVPAELDPTLDVALHADPRALPRNAGSRNHPDLPAPIVDLVHSRLSDE